MRVLGNHLAHDGSRQFLSLPESSSFHEVCDCVRAFVGAELIGFTTDDVTEAWIDFTYKCHAFSVNNQFGEYCFFVADPKFPAQILYEVADHFAELLEANT